VLQARLDAMAALLTPAESELVELTRLGLSNRELAARRRSSLRTVENQLAAAYRKLGVASRRELCAVEQPGGATSPAPGLTASLTAREHQVLAAAKAGQSNKCIAYALGVTISTVSTTLTRARRKLSQSASRSSRAGL
jgi:DNA-binding CsgD family transcriptional regulator